MLKYQRYCTGQYALVDMFYRHIWLNLNDETVAHHIRTTFFAKASTLVYDLGSFSNWQESPPTVDSDCCFDWQIPISSDLSLIDQKLHNDALYKTHRAAESQRLINGQAQTLLGPQRCKELQCQMILYKDILQQTKLHKKQNTEPDHLRHQWFDRLNLIFARSIHLKEIENELYDYAHEIIDYDLNVFIKILDNIDSLYA